MKGQNDMPLSVPDVAELDMLTAALAYAKCGWYVGPLKAGTKNPGSRLGKDWQTQTSRDPEMIVAWFAGTNDGLFLHAGRSGAVILDVDHPQKLGGVLLDAIATAQPPTQATRADHPGRGHYVFTQPPGRVLGNGLGKLPGGWGEIRGRNGVIVAEPTPHPDDGLYAWRRTGPVPLLPEPVAELLHDTTNAQDAATDIEVRAFLDEHMASHRPALLDAFISTFRAKVEAGESRHDSMVSVCAGAMTEARAGYYPARVAMERLEEAFLEAVSADGHGHQGKARTSGIARSEWMGISAWGVAQAKAANLDEVHARLAEKVPDGDDLSWINSELPGDDEDDQVRRSGDPEADLANARQMVAMFGDRIRYIVAWKKWLCWDSKRWRIDETGEIYRYAKQVSDALPKTSKNGGPSRTQTAAGINSMINLAGTEPGIALAPDQLDADPHLFNVTNGTVDLRTGELQPHNPNNLITKIAGAAYDPHAPCPEFTKFLERVQPDPDMRDFLGRLFGHALLGKVVEHVLGIFYGTGANGKTTLVEAVTSVFGNYGDTIEPGLLIDRGETHPTGTSDLFGLRLAVTHETDAGRRLAESTVKRLTGGDRIKARRMREDFWSFKPSHSIIMATNHKPVVRGTDEGIWRRLRFIPFDVVIPEQERDGTLPEKLTHEADGILAWIIAGYHQWRDHRLAEPEQVSAATTAFRHESDMLGLFLEERCVLSSAMVVQSSELYTAWFDWCRNENHEPGTQTAFSRTLQDRGFDPPKKNGYGRMIWRGIGLNGGDSDE